MALIIKQATATLTKDDSHKGKTVSEQLDTEHVGKSVAFDAPPCTVMVQAKLTINLGNYNSTQIGCSLALPCLHGEIDAVFTYAKEWVDKKMAEMADEAHAAQSD